MIVPVLLVVWAAGLAVYDLRSRRLPNWLLACGAAIGAVHGVMVGVMPFGATISNGAGTAALALAVYWPAYRMHWMGAGDVKFCAVIGWLGGAKALLVVTLGGTVIAGVLGLATMVPWMMEYLSSPALEARLRQRIPLGTGLAVAFITWAVLET